MKTKFVAAVAVFAVLASAPAFAQDKAPAKVSKAEVQRSSTASKATRRKWLSFAIL